MLIQIAETAIITTILVLWISLAYKELNRLKKAVENAEQQFQMHEELIFKARSDPMVERQAISMFEISCKIYNENVRKYNEAVRRLYFYPIAMVLGYRIKKEITKGI